MREALVLALLALLAIPLVSAAEPIQVSFSSPARVEGDVQLHGTWAILEFQPSSADSVFFARPQSPVVFTYTNATWLSYDDPFQSHGEQRLPEDSSGHREGMLQEFTARWQQTGYLGIRASDIVLAASGTGMELRSMTQSDIGDLSARGGNDDAFSDWAALNTADQVVASATDQLLTLDIQGLQAIELLGSSIDCVEGVCPLGGTWSTTTAGSAQVDAMSFERISNLSGSATFEGRPVRIRIGGPSVDGAISGTMRMPQAEVPGSCKCPLDGDATLALQGQFDLGHVVATGRDRMAGSVSGEGLQTFSDGRPFLMPQLAVISVAATAGIMAFAVAAKLLFALFTRLSKQEALEHPKRQQIFHYIQEHPGANFREVARNTSIASGTVRHHLTVLERSGHVVEHPHQGTVRLFENHGKFDHNWSDLVLLREPPLAKLHDWLKQHPASPQKNALEAMELEGWSRSTTQHRLARLVHGGLATIRLQGRLKIYSAAERPANPRPASPFAAIVSSQAT